MPKFRFAVRSKEGKLRTGTVSEVDLSAAKDRLVKAGFMIVTLAEESELVIHQNVSTGSVSRPTPERASIIEFEMTGWERFVSFFNTYILRKEFALVLFVMGAAWAGYLFITREGPPVDTSAKYVVYKIEVEVDPGPLKGSTYVVSLPDVPLRFSKSASPQGNRETLPFDFEALKEPKKVEVSFVDSGDSLIGSGEGTLTSKEAGVLGVSIVLEAVKPTPSP